MMAAAEKPAGTWSSWLRAGVARVASRLGGEVIAEEAPGAMTGVTKEQKATAVEKGEYFPLHQFSIPPEAVEKAREDEARTRAAVRARAEGGAGK
jgi:hypothetical protein